MKIYSDGADISSMNKINNYVDGFTTNPTLMLKAGIKDYLDFAKQITSQFDKPISFEVFSDDFDEMYDQALTLSSLSDNVYVKIPVTNTKGNPSYELINKLSHENVKVNVTAVFTFNQIFKINQVLNEKEKSIISIFAGRIADTGIDPRPYVSYACNNKVENCEILWASTREVLNIYQAKKCGCDIITVAPTLIEKYNKFKDKHLDKFSLNTVKEFYEDAKKAGYTI